MRHTPLILLTALALGTASAQTLPSYRILAPATAGGGYDTLARMLGKSLQGARITTANTVYNVPGDGGVVGLRDFIKKEGQGNELVVFGLTTIAAMKTTPNAGVSLQNLTPVARLVNDYEVLIVPAASPYKTLGDLVQAFKATPGTLRFGGASVASAGHLFTGNVLQAGGGNVRALKWVPSSGNLQAIKAMLAGELEVVSSSYGVAEPDIKAGRVRALALSAPDRVDGINVPTAREQGVDAELVNWRGVFAPANLSSAQKASLSSTLGRLARSSTWRDALAAEKQNSYYQPAVTFAYFLDREVPRIQKLLVDLGLARP